MSAIGVNEGIKPYTPHPTPHTLHPTPYTPHPTPHTLHPTNRLFAANPNY
ncbi:MAG UNVERIFIED_CONTAM: hypothetical protein LVR29_34055 [Microcystis novacekii LVE1205-3]